MVAAGDAIEPIPDSGWSDLRFDGPPFLDPVPALVSGALTERFASRRIVISRS